jgi:Tfp pilus tip-associated adhesin PilY1
MKLYTPIKNPNGNTSLKHYMAILQKLTSELYHKVMIEFFKPKEKDNYNFKLDPQRFKSKTKQKQLKNSITQIHESGHSYAYLAVIWPLPYLIEKVLPVILEEINNSIDSKPIRITYTQYKGTDGLPRYQLTILDKQVEYDKDNYETNKDNAKAARKAAAEAMKADMFNFPSRTDMRQQFYKGTLPFSSIGSSTSSIPISSISSSSTSSIPISSGSRQMDIEVPGRTPRRTIDWEGLTPLRPPANWVNPGLPPSSFADELKKNE